MTQARNDSADRDAAARSIEDDGCTYRVRTVMRVAGETGSRYVEVDGSVRVIVQDGHWRNVSWGEADCR